MKKLLSILLIISQMILVLPANANAVQGPSQEIGLLSQLIALQGQKVSLEEFQNGEKQILTDYVNSAPAEGMQDRLLVAATQMNVISASQAAAIQDSSAKAAEQFTAQGGMTLESLQQAASSSFQEIFQKPMAGAQFAACDAEGVAIGLGVTALAGFLFVVASRSHTAENKILISVAVAPIAIFGLIELTLGALSIGSAFGC